MGEVLNLVGFGEHEGDAFGTKRVGSTPPVDELGSTVFRWTHTSAIQNDSDAGDSGSPLFLNIGGVDQLVGVVSGGTNAISGLGDIATNTRVDTSLAWIKSVVPSIQVADVPDAPSLLLEDLELFNDENAGKHLVGFEVSASDSVTFSISATNPTMFKVLRVDYENTGLGDVVFETGVNQRGTTSIVVTASAGNLSTTQTITVTVEERNDPPTFDIVPPVVLDITPGPQTIVLTGITAGVGETGKVLVSVVDVTPLSMFSSISVSQPSGNNNTNGGGDGEASDPTLSFTPKPDFAGSGEIFVEIRDAGEDGKFNTNDDQTTLQFVNVTTTSNKAPTLDAIANKRLLLSAGEQTIALSGIGDGGTGTQSLRFSINSTNPSIANVLVEYDDVLHASTGQLRVIPSQLGSTSITVSISDAGDDGLIDTFDDRKVMRTVQLNIVALLNPWQNPSNPLDVDGDNILSATDALVVINAINRGELGLLPERTSAVPPYYDVDGSGSLEPLDALIIINELNRIASSGEGESKVRVMEGVRTSDSKSTEKSDGLPCINSKEENVTESLGFESDLWSDLSWLPMNEDFSSLLIKSSGHRKNRSAR